MRFTKEQYKIVTKLIKVCDLKENHWRPISSMVFYDAVKKEIGTVNNSMLRVEPMILDSDENLFFQRDKFTAKLPRGATAIDVAEIDPAPNAHIPEVDRHVKPYEHPKNAPFFIGLNLSLLDTFRKTLPQSNLIVTFVIDGNERMIKIFQRRDSDSRFIGVIFPFRVKEPQNCGD